MSGFARYFLVRDDSRLYDGFMETKAPYIQVILPLTKTTSADLVSSTFDEEILTRMARTIETESPVRESILFKRVVNSFGLAKIGARILARFRLIADKAERTITMDGDEKVYWNDLPKALCYRPCSEDVRYSYQIPWAEGAVAIQSLLETKRTFTKNALLQAFSEAFGYKRKGAQVSAFFEGSLKAGIENGSFQRLKNGRFSI